MDTKTKELIALGASYALNCHPCMDFHSKACLDAGATEDDMRQAMDMAEKVKQGSGRITQEKANEMLPSS